MTQRTRRAPAQTDTLHSHPVHWPQEAPKAGDREAT